MKEILQRINLLIKEKYRSRITLFAKETGIGDTTIRAWLRDNRDVRSEFLQKIIQNTGVNAKWLLTGEGEMFSKNDQSPPKPEEPATDRYTEADAEQMLVAQVYSKTGYRYSEEFRRQARKELTRILNEKTDRKGDE